MNQIPWLFVALLLIGMLIHVGLGVYSRRFKIQPVQLPFEILMYLCVLWTVTFALDISTDSLDYKILLMKIRFLGLPFISLSLMLIAIHFTGHGKWLTKRRMALLLVIPIITVLLALTTEYSTVFRYNYTLVQTAGGFFVLGFTNGIWSRGVYLPFNYIEEAVTLMLLLQMIFGSQRLYARQALLFFVAILIPVIADILFLFGRTPVKNYNIVPSTFAFTGILLAIALFQYRFIDIVPVARNTLFERMSEPMLVIDRLGRLADFNPAAEKVLGLCRAKNLGKGAVDVLHEHEELCACIEEVHTACSHIAIGAGSEDHVFDVSIEKLASGAGALPERLVLLRDVTDRSQSEKELKETRDYLDKLINYANAPIIVWDPLRRINRFNFAFERISGYDAKDVLGNDLSMLFPEQSRENSIRRIEDAIKGEKWVSVEIPILNKSGEIRTALWNSANIYSQSGELQAVIAQGQDITERKRVEEILARGEEKFRKAFVTSPDSVSINRLSDGMFVSINKGFTQISGYTEEETIGKTSLEINIWKDPADRKKIVEELLARGEVRDYEASFLTKKGEIDGLMFASIIELNGVPHILNITRDITEHKKAERALRESEEKFRRLIQFAPLPLCYVDRDGVINFRNERFVKVFGYTSKEVPTLKEWWQNAYPDEQYRKWVIQNWNFAVRHATETGNDIESEIYHVTCKDGTVREIIISGITINDNFLATFVDVTERLQKEAALKESERAKTEILDRLNEAQHIAAIGSWEWNLQTNEVWWSDETYRIFGVTPQDFSPNFAANRRFIHPDDAAKYDQSFELSLQTGEPLDFELRLVAGNGRLKHCHGKGKIIYSDSGQMARFIGTIMDITERKNAEEALQESEEKYHTLYNNMQEGVALHELVYDDLGQPIEYKIVDVNPRFESILNIKRDMVLNKRSKQAYGTDLPPYLSQYSAVAQSGIPQHFETYFSPLNKHLEISVSSWGRNGFATIFSDITERKLAIEALQESERRLNEAQKLAQLGHWIWDVRTGKVEWSQEVFMIFHLDPLEFTPQIDSIQALSPWPEDHERDRELINRATMTHEKGNYEQRFLRPDKSIGYYQSTFQGKYDDKGNLTFIIGTIQDITDRKRAEEKLALYARRLTILNRVDRVISSSLDIEQVYDRFANELKELVSIDRTSLVLLDESKEHWTVAMLWTGYEPIIGKDGWRDVKGSSIEWLVAQKLPLVEGEIGEKGNWTESEPLRREGIRSRVLLPLIAKGEITGVLALASQKPAAYDEMDLEILMPLADQFSLMNQNSVLYNQLKQQSANLERAVEKRTAQLLAANKELEAFSYSVSHDLRSPLRAMDGFSRILLEEHLAELSPDARHYLDLVRSNAVQMGQLIDDLLTFSRTSRQPLAKRLVNPAEVVEQVLEELQGELQGRNVEVNVGDLLPCRADPAMLKRVFFNLISNAVKFTRKKDEARIDIGGINNEGKTTYFVKDNGVGFDMRYSSKLFSVFSRLHSESDYEGTGVGLAIVARIVHRHGGSIWAEADVGKGAAFYFTMEEGESL